MKQSIMILMLLFLAASCSEKKVAPVTKNENIDVGEFHLNVKTRGTGSSTIVFEAGLSDDQTEWTVETTLFTTLAEDHQVIIYNRAGYKPSDPAPESKPRTITQIAKELHKVITEVSLNNKVILVGHSFGGMIVRKYADMYPDKVEGILFIDPTHEDDLDPYYLQIDEEELVPYFEGMGKFHLAAECMQFVENYDIISTVGDLPDIPVRVLTCMVPDLDEGETEADMDVKFAAHKTLGAGLSNFKHTATSNSDHHIHHSEADLVLTAIDEIVD